MRLYALLIVLCLSLLLFAQIRWDEDCQLAESHYEFWQDSVSGTGVSYYCWVEESIDGFQIKTQGVGIDEELIWSEPVVQDGISEFPISVQISIDEADNVYLYWSDYIYPDSLRTEHLQKVSSTGELLWGANGRIIDLPTSSVNIFSDQIGGLYCNTTNYIQQRYWHFDDNGEIMPGWENGIELGERNSLEHLVTGAGDLVLFKKVDEIEQPGRYFQVLSAGGEYQYPGEGIFCGECDSYKGGIQKLDGEEHMLVWVNNGTILGNKLASGGLLFIEPVLLAEGGDVNHFRSVLHQDEFYYICLDDNDQETCRMWKYNEDWQLINSGSDLMYEGDLEYVQVKPNGNVILAQQDYSEVTLIEYNVLGELISPEEGGWITILYSYQYRGELGGDRLGNTFISKAVPNERGHIGFYLQVLDSESEFIFADEGLLISQNRQINLIDCRMFPMGDKTAFCWTEETDFITRFMIQYVDHEGNMLLPEGGMQLLYNDGYEVSFQVYCGNESSLLIGESSQEGWFDEEYDYIHQVILDDEPWLIWGEDGIDVTELNGGDMKVIKQGEDGFFLYWRNSSNNMTAQLLVNGEFMLEEDHDLGLDYGTILSITDNYCTFRHGNDILLTRWNDNFEPVWDSPVWLTGIGYFDSGSFDYILDGNLVKYWVSYEGASMQEFSWRIKKQIITSEGEKLLGLYAPIMYDNGEMKIRDFFYVEEPEQIGVICGADDEFLLKYMTTSGEMISDEYITFAELNGRYFSNIYTQQSLLMVKTQYHHVEPYSDLTGICVYDLEGNSVEGLPDAEFGIPREDFSDICTDNSGIYYSWRTRHLENSSSNQSGGYDAYAQEICLPINGNMIDLLPTAKMKLKTYPNPFNPEVKISWQLAEICEDSKLAVFNIKGQKVREYRVNIKAGQITWNGKDTHQQQCASGVYLLRLQSGNERQSAKLLMLK